MTSADPFLGSQVFSESRQGEKRRYTHVRVFGSKSFSSSRGRVSGGMKAPKKSKIRPLKSTTGIILHMIRAP
jgi:hypothetical protein